MSTTRFIQHRLFREDERSKGIFTSIGIQLSYELLYKQAEDLLYPYKLQHLTDAELDLVKSGAEEIFYSFLLVNNADQKKYRDFQTKMMNLYTQNRNIYPLSVRDAKRMINNYVPNFVPTTPTRREARNRTKKRNRPRKRNYFSYSNRTRTGSTVDGVRRSIWQRTMIVCKPRILELPKQQQTRPQTKLNKKIRPMKNNNLKDPKKECIYSYKQFKRTTKLI